MGVIYYHSSTWIQCLSFEFSQYLHPLTTNKGSVKHCCSNMITFCHCTLGIWSSLSQGVSTQYILNDQVNYRTGWGKVSSICCQTIQLLKGPSVVRTPPLVKMCTAPPKNTLKCFISLYVILVQSLGILSLAKGSTEM